ncbi:cobalt-precorrin-5B (C(1))-methyltransferase [Microbaculum marinum]|uniref:Cobalt-precorrin-5B C(1)-methyltransferase n=1 Tax=Microbaculum marinum TaxID=1764581 RepID=A0AAW9RS91_9HYPH
MDETRPLRRGWTTGTCATAAAKAAFAALVGGDFPDPVTVTLPGGQTPAFALARHDIGEDWARAGIVKDAGDDPDVTHGALIVATVRPGVPGGGVAFRAGEGVGTVTRPGLPMPPGEPAINPVPRRMIAQAIAEVCADTGASGDVDVEISIPGGETLAERTLNGRLGIVGGLSILGTTGIVVPYSCAAWIASIHRGIDVARATGRDHVAGATGSASEAAIARMHGLPDEALLDMGDFVGGTLKYLRTHPVPKVTIAGGIAKMTKLAQGFLDLHSKRGRVDLDALADVAVAEGGSDALRARIVAANTTPEAFAAAAEEGIPLGDVVAGAAWRTAADVIAGTGMALEIAVFDRDGNLAGHAPFAPVGDAAHDASGSRPRKRR